MSAQKANDRQKQMDLERIADALERLVTAADSIATALSLQTMRDAKTFPFSPCNNCGRFPDAKIGEPSAMCGVCYRQFKYHQPPTSQESADLELLKWLREMAPDTMRTWREHFERSKS